MENPVTPVVLPVLFTERNLTVPVTTPPSVFKDPTVATTTGKSTVRVASDLAPQQNPSLIKMGVVAWSGSENANKRYVNSVYLAVIMPVAAGPM
jgi:hypothetical protein